MIKRVKDNLQDGRKIFAEYPSDRELVSRIYKVLTKLNTTLKTNPVNKWPYELNRHLQNKHPIFSSFNLTVFEIFHKIKLE